MSELSELSGECDGCGEWNAECVCDEVPSDFYEPDLTAEEEKEIEAMAERSAQKILGMFCLGER